MIENTKRFTKPLAVVLSLFLVLIFFRIANIISFTVNDSFLIYGTFAIVISALLFWKRKSRIAVPILLLTILLSLVYIADKTNGVPESTSFDDIMITSNEVDEVKLKAVFYKGELKITSAEPSLINIMQKKDNKPIELSKKEKNKVLSVVAQRSKHFFQQLNTPGEWEIIVPEEQTKEITLQLDEISATLLLSEINAEKVTIHIENSVAKIYLNDQQEVNIQAEKSVLSLVTPKESSIIVNEIQSTIDNNADFEKNDNVYGTSTDETKITVGLKNSLLQLDECVNC